MLTVLYSLAGLGIAIVNDFKSIEGDRLGAPGPTCLHILYWPASGSHRHADATLWLCCHFHRVMHAVPLLLVHASSITVRRELGMNSLPVAFGVDGAKYICAATIDVTQLSVAAYLYAGLHEPVYAAVLLGLTLPQVGGGDQTQDALSKDVLHRPTRHITLARERESASRFVPCGWSTYNL